MAKIPCRWLENVATLRQPEQAARHLQILMERNNEWQRTEQERADLAALAELSERLSLVRAEASLLLGRKPSCEMLVADESREIFTTRTVGHCEYCQMHQSLQGATLHIEHVIPRVLGGSSDASNLALAA